MEFKGALPEFGKSPSLIKLLIKINFTGQLIIGGHRSIVCGVICKIMIVI